MLAHVYRSARQEEMYLYLREKDRFDDIPAELMQRFGSAVWVMSVDLAARSKLAREDIAKVRAALESRGFYIQMPPRFEAPVPPGLSDE